MGQGRGGKKKGAGAREALPCLSLEALEGRDSWNYVHSPGYLLEPGAGSVPGSVRSTPSGNMRVCGEEEA